MPRAPSSKSSGRAARYSSAASKRRRQALYATEGNISLHAEKGGGATFITLEHYWPKEERLKYEDWSVYEEKIDQYDVYEYALQVTGKERDMPLTYLLATPLSEGWEGPPGGKRPCWTSSPSTSRASLPASSRRWRAHTTWRRRYPRGSPGKWRCASHPSPNRGGACRKEQPTCAGHGAAFLTTAASASITPMSKPARFIRPL